MKVIKQGQNAPVDRTTDSIFYGDRVEGQTIVGKGASKDFSFNTVTFFNGAKNHFHAHTSDQILFVLSGKGYVANESEELEFKDLYSLEILFAKSLSREWISVQFISGYDFLVVFVSLIMVSSNPSISESPCRDHVERHAILVYPLS